MDLYNKEVANRLKVPGGELCLIITTAAGNMVNNYYQMVLSKKTTQKEIGRYGFLRMVSR